MVDIKSLNDAEVINLYSDIIKELKARKIIRTKNVLGELGEYLAIQHYNNIPGLPKLQVAPVGTKNIDAISRDGDRYSIKSTSSNTTGVFTGIDFDNPNEVLSVRIGLVVCKMMENLKK